MGFQEQREGLHRLMILALDHEHPTTLVEIGEHRHVLMSAPARGLIDPDPLHPLEVLRLDRSVDVVVHDPPDPLVVLADQPRDRLHRHLLDHRHHQRLEQQREPRTLPRPRQRHLPHLVLRALHPRHPCGQERLVLKEVQMAPRLLLRVVRLQPRPVALRAAERRPLGKVHPQIQPLGRRIELHARDLPRLGQTQRRLEQNEILSLHPGSHHRGTEPIRQSATPDSYPHRLTTSLIVARRDAPQAALERHRPRGAPDGPRGSARSAGLERRGPRGAPAGTAGRDRRREMSASSTRKARPRGETGLRC